MRDPFGWPRGPFPVRLGAPALDLNFLTGAMPAGLTFTRASTATYIGSDGLLKTAAVDVPRLDYDPVTLACKGLLIEGSRTNLLLRSEQFDNAAWNKNQITVIADGVSAPSGSISAEKLVETISGSVEHFSDQAISVTAGTAYTFSCYLKPAGRTLISLGFRVASLWPGGLNQVVEFTLAGIGSAAIASGSPTHTIKDVGNGWYRCSITSTASATGSALARVQWVTVGDGTSGVYVWGAQNETGAFPTSYIPTTTAAVTRAADVCLMTGTNFSRWFNPVEGTIVAEFSTITNGLNSTGGNAFPHVYDFDSAAAPTSGHSLLASAGYGPGVRAQTQSAGVDQAAFNHAITLGTGAVMRQAYAYKTNDFASCLNGGAVATDALGILISPDRMAIGSMDAGGSNQLYGPVSRLRYYPRRLSNARLQELTA